jgi:ferredoxin
MFKFKVDEGKCIGCKKCQGVCPKGFKIWDYEKKSAGLKAIVKNSNYCLLCGMCMTVCPTKAIMIKIQ